MRVSASVSFALAPLLSHFQIQTNQTTSNHQEPKNKFQVKYMRIEFEVECIYTNLYTVRCVGWFESWLNHKLNFTPPNRTIAKILYNTISFITSLHFDLMIIHLPWYIQTVRRRRRRPSNTQSYTYTPSPSRLYAHTVKTIETNL